MNKAKEVRRRILQGEVEAVPYRKGQDTGCDYCGYRDVCGFDVKIPGCAYREIDKMSREEAIRAMKAAEEERGQL